MAGEGKKFGLPGGRSCSRIQWRSRHDKIADRGGSVFHALKIRLGLAISRDLKKKMTMNRIVFSVWGGI